MNGVLMLEISSGADLINPKDMGGIPLCNNRVFQVFWCQILKQIDPKP